MIALCCLGVVLFSIFASTHHRGDAVEDGWLLAAFAWITACAYVSVWSAAFVYEDTHWLPIWQGGAFPSFAWLAYLPWLLASKVGGGAPWAYHGLALTVHLMNGLLLYRLLRPTLERGAVWAVALFWIWPTNVEAVAYLSGAREAFVACWTLLALLIVGTQDYPWERLFKLAGVGLCLGAAVATKSSGVVALGLVPLAACWLNPRFVRNTWPYVAAGLALLAWPALRAVWHLSQSEAVISIGWHPRFAAATITGLVGYIWPLELSVDHDWTLVPAVVLYIVALGLLPFLVMLFSEWKRTPLIAAAVLWALIAVAPRLVIQQAEVLNEHQVYLAYLGLWTVAGTWLA